MKVSVKAGIFYGAGVNVSRSGFILFLLNFRLFDKSSNAIITKTLDIQLFNEDCEYLQ